jgi:hypothetical protein
VTPTDRDVRRVATMTRIRNMIDRDPIRAHRALGNVLLGLTAAMFALGAVVGVLLTLILS